MPRRAHLGAFLSRVRHGRARSYDEVLRGGDARCGGSGGAKRPRALSPQGRYYLAQTLKQKAEPRPHALPGPGSRNELPEAQVKRRHAGENTCHMPRRSRSSPASSELPVRRRPVLGFAGATRKRNKVVQGARWLRREPRFALACPVRAGPTSSCRETSERKTARQTSPPSPWLRGRRTEKDRGGEGRALAAFGSSIRARLSRVRRS